MYFGSLQIFKTSFSCSSAEFDISLTWFKRRGGGAESWPTTCHPAGDSCLASSHLIGRLSVNLAKRIHRVRLFKKNDSWVKREDYVKIIIAASGISGLFPSLCAQLGQTIPACDRRGVLNQERLLSYWSARLYRVTDLMTMLSSRKCLASNFLECKWNRSINMEEK